MLSDIVKLYPGPENQFGWSAVQMDLPESIIKQYVVSPQPLNYPPAKSCTTAKKVNLETSRLRLKKQRERQRAKKELLDNSCQSLKDHKATPN